MAEQKDHWHVGVVYVPDSAPRWDWTPFPDIDQAKAEAEQR